MHMNFGKRLGSTMLVVGTCIGAGILALPLVGAQVGFVGSAITLSILACLAYCANLLIIEVNLAFPMHGNSYSSMSQALLGKKAKATVWVVYLFYMYALLIAYISGDASLVSHVCSYYFNFTIPNWLTALAFVVVFGFAVFTSTAAVDYLNRGLLSLKGIFLIGALVLLIPYVDVRNLFQSSGHSPKYLLTAIPIFLSAQNFAMIIPSLSNYLEKDLKAIKFAVTSGILIIMPIYIWWMFVAFGTVPMDGANGFRAVIHSHGSVGGFVSAISAIAKNKYVILGINGFTNVTMTTSFLGVSLALFDFLADGFKRANTKVGRLQTALLTYLPPLIFVLFFKNAFVAALGFAGAFVALLFVVFPGLMAYKLRRQNKLVSSYRAPIGKIFLWFLVCFGVIVICIRILNAFIT
jgi:tyrosine-specific transport protein